MCHYFSQAKLPEDALDFAQMTTISIEGDKKKTKNPKKTKNMAPAAAR